MESLIAHRRAGDPFVVAMILFENIVEVFDQLDLDHLCAAGEFQDRVHRLKPGQVGTTPQLISALIGYAGKDVMLSTPYFVLDPTVLEACVRLRIATSQ